MLTGDLLRAKVRPKTVEPKLVDPDDVSLLETATALVETFREYTNRERGELKAALEARLARGDADRVKLERGLAKLLEDRSTFERASTLDPEETRALVYERAARAREKGEFDRSRVLAETASELASREGAAAVDAATVESALDADRKSREALLSTEAVDARALLVRYNVALCQAVLLKATRVRVEVDAPPARVRLLLRAMKFRQLLFRAWPGKVLLAARPGKKAREGVVLEIDGPLSIFGPSSKYGLALAEVLPAILLCERFSLVAELAWRKKRPGASTKAPAKTFSLMDRDLVGPSGKTWLRSPIPDPGAAPPVELEAFARRFEEIAPGWKVDDSVPVLFLGEGLERDALVPDLRFFHESGKTGYLELLTTARRGSVAPRLALLLEHGPKGLVVAVEKRLVEDAGSLPESVVVFRSMPLAVDVLERLEKSLDAGA
ncbi:DUF790 family protein [bacterium]|nr:DUF790 family protein [bacterium]